MEQTVNKDVFDIYAKATDKNTDAITEIVKCNEKLTHIIETHDNRIGDLDSRMKSLEKRPLVIIEKVIIAILTAVASVGVTLLIKG